MTKPAQGDQGRISLTRTRWQTARYHLTSPAIVAVTTVSIAAGIIAPILVVMPGAATAHQVTTTSNATEPAPAVTVVVTSAPEPTGITADTTSAAPELPVTLTVGPLTAIRLGVIPGTTVGELLEERGVTLGADDTVSPGEDHIIAAGDQVAVTQVRFETSTEDAVLPQPESRTVPDTTMVKGVSAIAQQGRPGVERVTYRTKVTNGVPGEREVVSRRTITEPLPTITKVGTKVAPRPPSTTVPVPSTASSRSTTPPVPATPVAQERVVTIRCETAATVQVTVTGPGEVSLALDPGGSWTSDGKVIGSTTLPGPGSVTATFTGIYYSLSALGGVCQ